ncbi:hypothetical protein Poly51_62110 [Rubripirellula tenax]|uniref:Uncharacterized protein n=1 Tax=Rubripirellula tenax TaxID=2528015 RepID=A0A5C6E916_9BACT|nr:hypothetical protein [Rubripirellula tenax]TWU43689.1 hypothetical protein Poly51_62110 [Rubripirellula tenax]
MTCTGVAVVTFARNHDVRRHPVMSNVPRMNDLRSTLTIAVLLMLGCSQQGTAPQSASELKPLGIPLPEEAANALRDGSGFKLYSIDPMIRDAGPEPDGFHDYAVLGSTVVTRTEQDRLFESLSEGVEASVGAIAACFDPRHGIRVEHDGKVYDFLICFECLQIYWYTDGENNSTILVSDSPLDVFNTVLSDASIALPDPA